MKRRPRLKGNGQRAYICARCSFERLFLQFEEFNSLLSNTETQADWNNSSKATNTCSNFLYYIPLKLISLFKDETKKERPSANHWWLNCEGLNSTRPHMPLAAAKRSMYDHGVQHHSQMSATRFWGRRKTGEPWEKILESGSDRMELSTRTLAEVESVKYANLIKFFLGQRDSYARLHLKQKFVDYPVHVLLNESIGFHARKVLQ